MVRRFAALFVLVTLSGIVRSQPDILVIRGARVLDGSGAPAREGTVVVRGGVIESVGPGGATPSGARVIDATGETLLPGLFDLHTHLTASAATGVPGDWGKNLKAYLDCGVTTVNDYSTYGEMFAPMRRMLSTGVVAGPHVNLAYRISSPGGHGTEGGWGDAMTFEAATPEQAHALMPRVLAYKPDIIKVFTDGWRYGAAPDLTNMNLETLAAIVSDAHAAGIRIFTHTVTLAGAKTAARAGVDVLVHGIGDAPVDDELIALLKSKGTFYVSTLAVYEQHQWSQIPDRLSVVLEPAVRAATRDASEASDARKKRWQNLLSNVHHLSEAGVPVAVGTDAGMAGTFHGYATLREMELLVEAGMTPLQAVTAGTGVSARALAVRDRGIIAPGKVADLLLVKGRPDERIADIEKTDRVFLAGREVERAPLEAAIATTAPTPLPVHAVPPDVDNMERTDGRTLLGTLRVNSTDAGVDHSTMMFLPVLRAAADHALLVTARMAAKDRPRVRLELPLTEGAVELADITKYTGVSFEVRGEGTYRCLFLTYGGPSADPFAAPFSASVEWQTVRIPFTEFKRRADAAPAWTGRDVRALSFEISGPPGAMPYLEIDNVKFY